LFGVSALTAGRGAPLTKILAERFVGIKIRDLIRRSNTMRRHHNFVVLINPNDEDRVEIAGFINGVLTILGGALNRSDGECRSNALLISPFHSCVPAAPSNWCGGVLLPLIRR
jgi:hypothetical protein